MKITEEEFIKRVHELAENNHKVRALLKHNGSYEQIPEFQKNLICEALGVKVKVITEYTLVSQPS